MLKLGKYTIVKTAESAPYVRSMELLDQVNRLEAKNARLEREKAELEKIANQKPVQIDFVGHDPVPTDKEARKQYVASVAALHTDILKPKLEHMISNAYLMLEESSNERSLDQAIKGAIYAFREFIRWGESMVNEQLANQAGESPDEPETKEEK